MDELLVTHERATKGVLVQNTWDEDLRIIKFFGLDIPPDAPEIPIRKKQDGK